MIVFKIFGIVFVICIILTVAIFVLTDDVEVIDNSDGSILCMDGKPCVKTNLYTKCDKCSDCPFCEGGRDD